MENFLAIESHSGQATENVCHIPGKFSVRIVFKKFEKHFNKVGLENCLGVFMIDEEISESHSYSPQAFQSKDIFWRVVFLNVVVNGFQNKRVLGEQERSLSVDTKDQKSIDGKYDLIFKVALEAHDQMLDFCHHRVELCSFEVRNSSIVICFIVVLLELG